MGLTKDENKERLILRKYQLDSLIDFVNNWLADNPHAPQLIITGADQLVEKAESERRKILLEIDPDAK